MTYAERCSMFLALIAAGLTLGCASAPPSDKWSTPPVPGSAPPGSPVALHGQLAVAGVPAVAADGTPTVVYQLVDQNGVPVQLKGVSGSGLNYESQPFAESKPALTWMRDNWKLSVIRAAMTVNSKAGAATDLLPTTQPKAEIILQHAVELGVYVMVDWHTEDAINQQDAAVAYYTQMATTYGAYPNVIWEPWNEPAGNPRYTWAQIKAYHQAVVDAVRSVDPDNLMVLGTPSWSQNVDQAAADPVVGTNLLYTLHWYSCTHGPSIRSKGDTAIAGGVALFVSEFGATFSDGGLASNGHDYVCEDEANLWLGWMAQHNISGVAWKLDADGHSSSILTADAAVNGPWTDDKLTSDAGGALYAGALQGGASGTAIQGGHGQFVASWLRQ